MIHDMEFGLTDRETSPNREAANRQRMGGKKYAEMVDRGSKKAEHKNLPYSFSKPRKTSARSVVCECPACYEIMFVTKTTVMAICSGCKKLFDVVSVFAEKK